MMRTMLLVALGGGIGSATRYLVSKLMHDTIGVASAFGTLAVNVCGCLLIGLLCGMSARGHIGGNATKALLVTGFCGGFTTFSTFCNENLALMRGAHAMHAALYAGGSVALGLLAVAAGYWVAERL